MPTRIHVAVAGEEMAYQGKDGSRVDPFPLAVVRGKTIHCQSCSEKDLPFVCSLSTSLPGKLSQRVFKKCRPLHMFAWNCFCTF